MKIFITYSGKSSLTGKAIREEMRILRKKTHKKARCDILIRWGSTQEFPNLKPKLELNNLDAVKRATNKLLMLQTLAAAGITVPMFNTTVEDVDQYKDKSGNFYIRNKQGVVRYGNDFTPSTDLYYSKPVLFKRREYRVHVFRGKILGIYEKIPMILGSENRPKLFKSDTCNFVKCDPTISRVDPEAQKLCIDSVVALGLDFGGVDLIRNKNAEFTICEVNSAPSLNSLNLKRWTNEIEEFKKSLASK